MDHCIENVISRHSNADNSTNFWQLIHVDTNDLRVLVRILVWKHEKENRQKREMNMKMEIKVSQPFGAQSCASMHVSVQLYLRHCHNS